MLVPTTAKQVAVAVGALVMAVLTAWAVAAFGPGGDPDPLHVSVQANTDLLTVGGQPVTGMYVTGNRPEKLPAPPVLTCAGRWKWAHGLGAVDADQTLAQVTLTVPTGEPVVVQAIRAELVGQRQAPLTGTTLDCPGGGGGQPVRLAIVDLDKRDLPVTVEPGPGDPTAAPGAPYSLQVVPGVAEVIDVVGKTSTCDCRWRLLLDVVAAGKHKAVTVDLDGQPFRTTSSNNAPRLRWDGTHWSAPAPPPTSTPQTTPGPGPACQALPQAQAAQATKDTLTDGTGTAQTSPGVTGKTMQIVDCSWTSKDHPGTVYRVSAAHLEEIADARAEYEAEKPMLLPNGQAPLSDVGQEAARETGHPGSSAGIVLNGHVIVTVTASSGADPPISSATLDAAVLSLLRLAVPAFGE